MKPGENFHTSAAVLIVTAAEKSGLLKEVAQALRYVDKTRYDQPDGTVAREFCPTCALLEELVEAFDEHTCLAVNTLTRFYYESFNLPEFSEEELAPYLGISPSESRA